MIRVTNRDAYTLRLTQDTCEQVIIRDCADMTFRLEVAKGIHAQVWIAYDGEQMCLRSELKLEADSTLRVLFWNRIAHKLDAHISFHGEANAQAWIGVGDLQDSEASYVFQADLKQAGMQVEWMSASLAAQKHWDLEIAHSHPYTRANMRNFAVVKENGDYHMVASGRIRKGAYESQSHQTSRVLTLSQKQRSEVLPILYIDENQVKASHATTLGQPDETQLYYLQSRGLSRAQALGLLTIGYLMPIISVLDHQEWQTQLQAEIEEKVMTDVE